MSTEGADRRGRFYVLDGVDGCGKTTQARRLVRSLDARGGQPALHLREPGSTAAGERLRALLLDPETRLSPATETLLFAAARRAMLEELVEPALGAGRDVVCERFHPATFAYQAVAGGLDEEAVLALLEDWAGRPVPDLVLLLDLEPDAAAARLDGRDGGPDRIEARGADFQARVAEGFRRYAERCPDAVVIDADSDEDAVAERILVEVERVAR
jgi:dTMP kinase